MLFGLPDVKPMQEALMREIEAKMMRTLSAMEPDALFKTWLPAGIQSFEQWQRFLWSKLTGAAAGESGEKSS